MKTPFIPLFLIGLSAILSCKKDNHSPAVQAVTSTAPKVKSFTSNSLTYNYSYDSAGRISRLDNIFGGKTTSWITYTYTDTAVLFGFQDTSGHPPLITVYKLGTEGAARGRALYSYQQGYYPNNVTRYVYNSNGQLVTSTQTMKTTGAPDYVQINQYYYSNGTLDSMTRYDTRFGRVYFATYYDSYYTDQQNTVGNDNFGKSWMGANTGAHPVKQSRLLENNGALISDPYIVTYQYDVSGRIINAVTTVGTSNAGNITYTY